MRPAGPARDRERMAEVSGGTESGYQLAVARGQSSVVSDGGQRTLKQRSIGGAVGVADSIP
jgi:hypothetical protein